MSLKFVLSEKGPGPVGGVCAVAFFGLLVGCSRPDEIRPSGDAASAKAVLLSALDSWKAGNSPAETQTEGTLIWTDPDWKQGQTLADYRLVNEPEQNGGHWRVYADLFLKARGKKAAPTRVCYAVTIGEPTSIIRSDFLH